MVYRNDLKLGKWQVMSRVGDYGAQRLYLSCFEEGNIFDGRLVFDGSGLMTDFIDGRMPKNAFLLPLGSGEESFPSVGDLVAVKCDLQFISAGCTFPQSYFLPQTLKDKFIMVDIISQQPRKVEEEETKYVPTLTLNVFLDIDGMLDLTAFDYEESMTDTKIWDMRDRGGLRLRDYISKRTKLFIKDDDNKRLAMRTNREDFKDDIVKFYTIAWQEDDIITGIPGIVETRRQKHWFFNNWNNNIYRSASDLTSETYVKFPLCGLVGTLMDTRVVSHSLTAGGQYIHGTDFKTIFYKIWFNGRTPVWVDAPVWKCPDPLSLPILLPIP